MDEIIIEILNNKVWLDELCWQCDGSREYEGEQCDVCGGIGYKPTDEGKAILDLIKRHRLTTTE